jgi:predicted nucleic acid-binding protein
MSDARQIYWDTSCFICLLNDSEVERQARCEAVLYEAEKGDVKIWTSYLTVAEVIRPKIPFECPPIPDWVAQLLSAVPREHAHLRKEFEKQFDNIWSKFKKQTRPSRRLTDQEIEKIEGMFRWPWLTNILVDEKIVQRAVSISQKYGLKPNDAIHVASALAVKKITAIQYWDKDYERVAELITVEPPTQVSSQGTLVWPKSEQAQSIDLGATPART